MTIATLTLAALAALPLAQQEALQAAQPATRLAANTTPKADVLGFPLPSADLELQVSGGAAPSLLSAFSRYGELTGQQIITDRESEPILNGLRLPLTATTVIPAENALAYLEALLYANDGVLVVERESSPRLLKLSSLNTSQRNTLRGRAKFIASSELATLREHPAMLFTTVLDLPHLDVRQVSNSLRTLVTDANTMQILPAGNTSTMVLTGFGGAVADLCEHLRLIDECSRPRPRAVAYELVRLQHAVAVDTAPLVERALASARALRIDPDPVPQQGPGQAPPAPIGVQADVRLNALLITCLADEMTEARRVIGLLDVK